MLNTEFSSNIIIECPNCETKFSVDPIKLPKADSFKFHCSRCDSNFESDKSENNLSPKIKFVPPGPQKVTSFETMNIDHFGKSVAAWPENKSAKVEKNFEKKNSENIELLENDSVTQAQSEDTAPKGFQIFLGIPAILAVLVLAGLAIFDQKTNFTSKFITQNLQKVPPLGIDLVGVKGERMILESGEEVFVISGKVLNASKNSYNNVSLETSLYDEKNNQLAKFDLPAINGLQSANVKGLNVKNLEELQNRESNNSLIQASGYQNFQVVVPTPSNDSRWFSIRLKSLKNS